MASVTVLGAGAWGTAFGQVLADAGNDVTMWAIEPDIVNAINTLHQNPVRLPVVNRLPDAMHATLGREEAVKDAEIIIVAIAAQFARQALDGFKGLIPPHAVVVSLMKGIERSTDKRMDQVVRETLAGVRGPVRDIVLLNAAAALVAYHGPDRRPVAEQLAQHLEEAAAAIDSGAATRLLQRWVDVTQEQRAASA